MFNDRTILITGGTGSLGWKLTELILSKYQPRRLIILSRDELKQYEMSQSFPPESGSPIRYFIGDVRDRDRLLRAFQNVDYVIHAAAMKQVPAAEYNPFEAVKTNIMGAQNVIDASIECGVKGVVALSSDKACAPVNLYGSTKLTSDKLFIAANNYKGSSPIKFGVVRYGNVMGSRGSVIPQFQRQKQLGEITITDERMTRFNITLREGANLVLNCLEKMHGGELYVPKLPSYRILDMAEAIAPGIKIKKIGIRPGEKIHEEMITATDSLNAVEFRNFYVLLPAVANPAQVEGICKANGPVVRHLDYGFCYNSGSNPEFLSVSQLRDLVQSGMNQ